MQRAVNPQAAVIADEAQLAEFVHEEIYPRARGADHVGERILADALENVGAIGALAVLVEQEQGAGKALLAGVEDAIDQVFLDAPIAVQQKLDQMRGNRTILLDQPQHRPALDDRDATGNERHRGRLMVRLATQAIFTKEVPVAQNSQYSAAAPSGNRRQFHQTFLDIVHFRAGSPLGKDHLVRVVLHGLFAGHEAQESISGNDRL